MQGDGVRAGPIDSRAIAGLLEAGGEELGGERLEGRGNIDDQALIKM